MHTIASYEQAKEALHGRQSKKLANNTYAELNHDGSIGIRLHATQVVIYFPDGRVRLTSGGWRTVTTKDRLNTYSPFDVTQKNHQWSVWTMGFNHPAVPPLKFQDGLTLKWDNAISKWMDCSNATANAEILLTSNGGQTFTRVPVSRARKERVYRGEEI